MLPVFSSLYAVPIVILYPIFTAWFGIGSESKIAFAGVYGFFPVMLSTAAGIRTIDPQYLLAARSMGATPAAADHPRHHSGLDPDRARRPAPGRRAHHHRRRRLGDADRRPPASAIWSRCNRTILDSPRVFAGILVDPGAVDRVRYAGARHRAAHAGLADRRPARSPPDRGRSRGTTPTAGARAGLNRGCVETDGRETVADHRRRQLSAARLAGRPRDAVEVACRACACRTSGACRSRTSSRRRTTPPSSPSATWSAPASTSSPTARSGAKATPTASPPRSRASTSPSPADRQGPLGPDDAGAARGRQDPPHARRSRCATCSSCARNTDRAAKITLPGPFTMSQQAQERVLQGRGRDGDGLSPPP